VNADDFGLSPGVNSGVIEAHERGIVTSASLMVRMTAAEEAATYARNDGNMSLGLHVDLGEWSFRNGEWQPVYEVVPLEDHEAVETEVRKQLESFRQMTGRDPTHLDSHQHVHRKEPARSVLLALGAELGVPVRHESAVRYCGEFYGQDESGNPLHELIRPQWLEAVLRTLPDGATELCCHPGYADGLDSTYAAEREQELAALVSPRLRPLLARERIELVSFASLPAGSAA
jgi:predicted glycoside hydrolase/deacetylase ChbG (UPF0249 family)